MDVKSYILLTKRILGKRIPNNRMKRKTNPIKQIAPPMEPVMMVKYPPDADTPLVPITTIEPAAKAKSIQTIDGKRVATATMTIPLVSCRTATIFGCFGTVSAKMRQKVRDVIAR